MSLSGPGGPPRSLPVSAADLLLILIVVLGSVRLAGALLGGAVRPAFGEPEPGRDEVLIATLALLLFEALIVLGAVRAIVLKRYGLTWTDLGLRPTERRWVVRAAAIAVLLIPVVALINAQIPRFADEPLQNPQIRAIAPAGFSWSAFVGMMVLAGWLVPFAEEVAFRGVLFPWLRDRFGILGAAVLSALCFALLHGLLWLIPSLTVVGIALALVYERSGSLWAAVVTHGVFNTVMIAAVYAALAGGLQLP